jgi:CelD/BcsL family acetyltransferase involved in cellulose biosynthesis
MNVVALRPHPAADRSVPVPESRIARVEIIDDLALAEPHWRALERGNVLASPYQRYDFLKLWQRHIGNRAGVTPFIVVGFDVRGDPLFLWPFGCRTLAGLRVVEFLGGKHANFNLGLWRRDIAAAIDAGTLRALLGQLSARADLLRLINQPLTWGGTTNPFALLPHQRAADFGFSGSLIPDYEALLCAHTNSATRKKMRKKERALTAYGVVRFEQARAPQDIRRVLDVFFKQKSARMHKLGVRDAFATPDVRRFIEAAAAERLADGEPLVELYALSVGDLIVATFGGMVSGGRFSGMFNSIIDERYSAESPGEQLLATLVRHSCARGLDTFDLGIGQANYKALFCADVEPLFDSYLPLRAIARPLALTFATLARIKRSLKQNATLWAAISSLRRLRARFSATP